MKEKPTERPDDLPVPSSSEPNISTINDQNESETGPQEESEAGSQMENKPRKLSDQCFIVLFWAMVLSQLWVHFWLIQLLPILFVVLAIKKLGEWFYLNNFQQNRILEN